MALDLSTLTAEQQVAAIYIGYFDRAADPLGEDFWETAVDNPAISLADIATDFSTQPESLDVHPFFSDPTPAAANAFITELYLNLFNREPDAAGLTFWSSALVDAINDEPGSIEVGEIILAIIEGAQDSSEGNDRTTILNKIEVATAWTDAADNADIDYLNDTAAQNSAGSIINPVTDDPATVTAAKATIDAFFDRGTVVDGDTILLTSATDVETGTADNDEFLGYIQQNPFAGGVSNSLSSADRLDGGAGDDRLYAELSLEFLGASAAGAGATDIQPRIKNIEEIDIEARDYGADRAGDPTDDNIFDGDSTSTDSDRVPSVTPITVDAKNITDHVEIGSYFSDGDLKIENLTTLTSSGNARNTSEITITMDHTDNFNTDGDASDLEVLFDNDYLLSGQEAEGKIFYFLLDEDAELVGNPNRLNNIDVDGIRFTIDTGSGPVDVTIEDIAANTAGTHQGFVNALQPRLQELIADGTLPAGTTLTLDPTVTDTTFLDDGSESDLIPAIVLESGDGSEVIATGFTRIEEPIGEYDVYGRFRSENEIQDQPISIDIDLHKVGRGGEGGDLIIGGKSTDVADGIAAGIEVFNINVLGAGDDDPNGGMTKPSSLGQITSTDGALDVVNIATDAAFASGETFASLEVRDGFDGNTSLINADAFLGDLMLHDVSDADTITAQGGGDVTLELYYTGDETDTAYSVTTGSGDDDIGIDLDGDALDYAGSSLNVSTGAGDDSIDVTFEAGEDEDGDDNQQLNQVILDNVEIDGGSGDDFINVDGVGNAKIMGGTGDDTIFTDGDGDQFNDRAIWAFNFDANRVGEAFDLSDIAPDELPGEQLSLAYIGGATVTVTLSGAGTEQIGGTAFGGGVMALDGDSATGAIPLEDGYEASVTINQLVNGRDHFGTQEDINLAVKEAIEEDPILSQLLTVTMTSNNTMIIASTTSGDFNEEDLRIDIEQLNYGDGDARWSSVEDEARAILRDSTYVLDDLADANAVANDLTTSADADAWYDGLSVLGDDDNSTDALVGEGIGNLHTSGDQSEQEADNVINGGAGDDLIVLSTDAVDGEVPDFTLSSNNALLNGASNETIVMTGDFFGNDTIMNFTTAGGGEDTAPNGPGSAPVVGGEDDDEPGLDFLDFTAYLTSESSASGSSVSAQMIDVTLDTDNATDIAENEVAIVQYDEDDTDDADTFDSLSASDIQNLFNSAAFDVDNFDQSQFSVAGSTTTVDDNGKAILMVENAQNLGEYKVFELSWDTDVDGDDGDVSATLLGSLDFGDSLDGVAEVNLVGSDAYDTLIETGFGSGV